MTTATTRRRIRSHLTGLACIGLVVFGCARVAAHDFWIEPSTFRAAAGTAVSVALRVGEHYKGDPVPRQAAMLERFVIAGPDGVRDVAGREGGDPAGVTTLETPGVYVIGYRSRPKSVELDAVKFEQYLREEGLERIIDQRKQAGRSNAPGIEIFSRCAKTIVASSPSADSPGRAIALKDVTLGLRLELIAERLAPGKPATFRLLYEGQPLEGALVVAIPKEEPLKKLSARSNKAGRVTFTLPIASASSAGGSGVWLVKAVHMVPAARETAAEWESLWASTTFELPAAGASAASTTAMTTRGARRSDGGARRSDPALPAGRASR
jgi:uncharacterized GH25 family protein